MKVKDWSKFVAGTIMAGLAGSHLIIKFGLTTFFVLLVFSMGVARIAESTGTDRSA